MVRSTSFAPPSRLAPHGVVVSGEDGTILFVNVLASAIFDYPPGELIGQSLSRLLPGAVPAAHDDQWTEFWKNPHSAAMIAGRTITGIRRDGVTVPLDIGLSAFDDGTTRHVIASIVDITERLDLEARLAAATHAHLGFQRLVADVAVRFGAIDPDAVDDAIVDGLRQIGEALQLDCATLWRWRADETRRAPLAALGSAVVLGSRAAADGVDPVRGRQPEGRRILLLRDGGRSARSRSRRVSSPRIPIRCRGASGANGRR